MNPTTKTLKVDINTYRLVEDFANAQGISLQSAATSIIQKALAQASEGSNAGNGNTATDHFKEYEVALKKHFDSLFGEGAWQGGNPFQRCLSARPRASRI
jgi:hypothetical protein